MKRLFIIPFLVVGMFLGGHAHQASAATYCISDCGQTVEVWCSQGYFWQVTGGDQWLQLGPAGKSCF